MQCVVSTRRAVNQFKYENIFVCAYVCVNTKAESTIFDYDLVKKNYVGYFDDTMHLPTWYILCR